MGLCLYPHNTKFCARLPYMNNDDLPEHEDTPGTGGARIVNRYSDLGSR